MKKMLFTFMALILTISLCSCNNLTSMDKHTLEMIYEIDNNLQNTEKSFNHKNIISDSVEYSKESNLSSNVKLTFDKNEKEFVYYDTLFYPVGGKKVNRYYENGKEDNIILLNEDGSINSILYEYAILDITDKDDPNDILIELKKELSKLIDISSYEYVRIPEFSNKEYRIYDYLFYNSVEGYTTDYMRVSVSTDGYVFGMSINNVVFEDFTLNINKSLEEKMINLKLADIYNTDETEYKSYDMVFPPNVVVYNNALHIRYFVVANYIDSNGTETESWLDCILIPINLMQVEN